jgi:hypothetical protein
MVEVGVGEDARQAAEEGGKVGEGSSGNLESAIVRSQSNLHRGVTYRDGKFLDELSRAVVEVTLYLISCESYQPVNQLTYAIYNL